MQIKDVCVMCISLKISDGNTDEVYSKVHVMKFSAYFTSQGKVLHKEFLIRKSSLGSLHKTLEDILVSNSI